MRAAIYTRFSSEKQSESSLEDQERNCRRRADAMEAVVVDVYRDKAISGSRSDRPAYQRMLEVAASGAFEVLLTDDLSRLSRDAVETERAIRRLEFEGIRVIGVCDGYDSVQKGRKLTRQMRAMINEVYLDDLREKTHRGLTGKAMKGMSAGGRTYGYATRNTEDGHVYVVNQAQAEIVREIFTMYASGASPRSIAEELNKRKVPSPRGSTWSYTALYGHGKKGTGILRNELYVGRLIWNRSQWVKNPDSGRRVRRERPQSEWIIHDDEELRIVPQELWERVQARLARIDAETASYSEARQAKTKSNAGRRRYLFSGLLRCGVCGGPMTIVNERSYGCSWHRNRGPSICSMKQTVRRATTENVLLAGIKDMLRRDVYRTAFKAEIKRLLSNARRELETQSINDELRKVEQELENILGAIAQVGISETLSSGLKRAELKKAQLAQQLSSSTKVQTNMLSIRSLDDLFDAMVDNLERALMEDVREARELLQAILGDSITVSPVEGSMIADVKAQLPNLRGKLGLNAVGFSGSGGRI